MIREITFTPFRRAPLFVDLRHRRGCAGGEVYPGKEGGDGGRLVISSRR